MTKINRGSEWRKWDLHIHSPYTIIDGNSSYKNVTDDDIIKKICQEKISVVGLTNYFKFSEDDYKLANKLRKVGISTFMNLEFRLTNFNNDKMLSDYHVIFSDKLSKKEIDNFLSNLDVSVGSCKKKINLLTDEEIKKNAAISFEELFETLQNESLNLKGKYLTAFLSIGHGNSVCGKGRGYTVYEEIVRKSDLVINSTDFNETLEHDKLYWLGKTSDKNKYIKPLLQSSDAHCLDDIGFKIRQVEEKNKDKSEVCKKGDNYSIKIPAFTWIKSDTTFEGLKQTIYEPEERIRYGESNPDDKAKYMVIDYIQYYDNEKIYFNSGLNAIIGGRSTGKSTLLNSIAKYQKNKNVYLNKHYTLEGDYKIFWKDGESKVERAVEFIPQEFMVSISTNQEMLNDLLREIISKKNMNIEEIQYKKKIEDIKNDINSAINDYFYQLSLQKELIKPEGDETAAINLMETINKNIEKIRLEYQFSEDDNKNYKYVSDNLNKILIEIKNLKLEKEQLIKIKNLDFSVNIELNQISSENQLLIGEKLKNIEESSKKQWVTLIENLIDKVENKIKIKNSEFEALKSSDIYLKGKNLESKNKEIRQLEVQLKTHEKVIEEFQIYNKKYALIKRILEEKYNFILNLFQKYYEAMQQFKVNFKIEESDLKIEIKFSAIDFEEKIDYLNARYSINNTFIENFNNIIKDFDERTLKEFFKRYLQNSNFVFNGNKNIDDLFKDIVTTNWFRYDYMVTYQNDEFQNMSQGKKSFVILKLLLEFSNDKKPVLIDQPEDSLDNRAIYYELRNYLLSTKKNRQIIIVTHNPNIVVGSDTENIIVAHQQSNLEKNKNGKKFQYINGSLENTRTHDKSCKFILESQGIREHVFDVLEGGEEAFTKREQKYNYNKII